MEDGTTAPEALVFDLDGCVWWPEMYHLWGGGGSPFRQDNRSGNVVDRSGTMVKFMGVSRSIFQELHCLEKWSKTKVAFASCCDEPSWACECIELFRVSEGVNLKDCVHHSEIHKGNKQGHLTSIKKKLGIDSFESMIFFDNEMGNCRSVAKLGVTVIYTPNGLTDGAWKLAQKQFPAPGQIITAP
mmetsp:Transcript_13036/g.15081  ORF Transcript_13036/g.15081 Transcript_13036/m.15081 type:complete len:186 (+) Transcript_13036:46-603(+)